MSDEGGRYREDEENPSRANLLLPKMTAQGVEFPTDLKVWETDIPEEDRVALVNQDDFPQEFVLKSLGISDHALTPSFGICDAEEIEGRLGVVNYLLKKKVVRHDVQHLHDHSLIPKHPASFMKTFRGGSPYWEGVHALEELLAGQVPPRIKRFKQFLADTMHLEEAEKQLSEVVMTRMEQISSIAGTIRGIVNSNKRYVHEDGSFWTQEELAMEGIPDKEWERYTHKLKSTDNGSCAFGYSQFNRTLLEDDKLELPEWVKNPQWWDWRNWLGITSRARREAVAEHRKKIELINSSRKIRHLPDCIETDILNYISKILFEHFSHMDLSGFSLRIHFEYFPSVRRKSQGVNLKVTVYSFSPRSERNSTPVSVFPPHFDGYSKTEEKYMSNVFSTVCKEVNDYREAVHMARLCGDKDKKIPSFIGEQKTIPSPKTDLELRWFSAPNIMASEQLHEAWDELCAHRKIVHDFLLQLKLVASLCDKIQEAATSIGTGVTKGKVLPEENNSVSFDGKIFPIQLLADIEDPKKIVPISGVSDVNGRPIGFTGFHGGGKTETALAMVVNMWLFQSGIPPLGSGVWQQNVKRMIGFVFIDNVRKHSTCQSLLIKMTNILEAMPRFQPKDVVLILDELGTGTQEDDGFDLGKDMLTECDAKGVSVLFTTQIQKLAEFAENHLKAACFRFDDKHQLTPGIGKGGMESLRQTSGFNSLLSTKQNDE